MIRKQENLKSFNLFHYLKEQDQQSMSIPYFIADDTTYKNAGVSFPIRNFVYGIGITYTGKPGGVKIGSADYVLQPGSLTTIGPGIVSQWEPDHNAKHETLFLRKASLPISSKILFEHIAIFPARRAACNTNLP